MTMTDTVADGMATFRPRLSGEDGARATLVIRACDWANVLALTECEVKGTLVLDLRSGVTFRVRRAKSKREDYVARPETAHLTRGR